MGNVASPGSASPCVQGDDAVRELLALAPDVEVLLPLDLRARTADAGRRSAEQHAPVEA